MLAWRNGDKPALDLVLDEVMADPVGVPGLLFSLIDFATRLGAQLYPDDFVEHLQASLAKRYRTTDTDGDGDGGGSALW